MKQPLCIPSSWGSDRLITASFTRWDVTFFISQKCGNVTALLWFDCEMTVVKLISHFRNTSHFHPPSSLSLQYFLKQGRARVRGVSWVFDLAGAQPSSLQASGALCKEKRSPAITRALSYPHWQQFIAEFILEKQNMSEWKSGWSKCFRPNNSNDYFSQWVTDSV